MKINLETNLTIVFGLIGIVLLQDELLPVVSCPSVELSDDEEDKNPEDDDGSRQDLGPTLSFSAPEALLRLPNAHPLRIFVCFLSHLSLSAENAMPIL